MILGWVSFTSLHTCSQVAKLPNEPENNKTTINPAGGDLLGSEPGSSMGLEHKEGCGGLGNSGSRDIRHCALNLPGTQHTC